jgi:hypothetical protein
MSTPVCLEAGASGAAGGAQGGPGLPRGGE